MIFDVMLLLKEKNAEGKERRVAYRIHDRDLSRFVRDAQDRGHYIEQVHPLFGQKKDVVRKQYRSDVVFNPIDSIGE
jgi:hypothetical protein